MALLEDLADLRNRDNVEVVVLDNASDDGSANAITTAYPDVSVVAQPYRAGFGANHNRVIRESRSEYVLLLNDDATTDAGSVDLLVDYLARNPEVSAVGPRILSPAGARLQTAWAKLGPTRAALFAATAGQVGWVQSTARSARKVGRVSGCALMLRRSALPDPVFDEDFFMYAEDSDLCSRLWRSGSEVHFVPGAEVIHQGRQSSAAVPHRRRVEQARSTRHYLHKHYGPTLSWATRVLLAIGYLEKLAADALISRVLKRRRLGRSARRVPGRRS